MTSSATALNQAVTQAIEEAVHEHPVTQRSLKIAVACSGGKDSMLLADVCADLLSSDQFSMIHALIILTVDHGLHPHSANFANEVVAYWRSRLIVSESLNADPKLIESGAGLEDGARRARYKALETVLNAQEINLILFAHHAGDQAETILMRLQGPSGLHGLSGIPSRRDWILRPWLNIHPDLIREEHERRGLPIFEDPSNHDQRFLRNSVRHSLSPSCDQVFDNKWVQRVSVSASHLREEAEVLAFFFQRFASSYIFDYRSIGRFILKVDEIDPYLPKAVEKKLLRHFYTLGLSALSPKLDLRRVQDQLSLLLEVWQTTNDQQRSLPHGLSLWGSRGYLIIYTERHLPALPHQVLIDDDMIKSGGIISWAEWALHITPYPSIAQSTVQKGVCFCQIKLPISLSLPPSGARFQPIGAPGRKRVTRLWSDRKIPVFERMRLPVLMDATNQILWIPHCRPSELITHKGSCHECSGHHLSWHLKTEPHS